MKLYNDLEKKFRQAQLQRNAESLRVNHPEFRMEQAAIKKETQEVLDLFRVQGGLKATITRHQVANNLENEGYAMRYAPTANTPSDWAGRQDDPSDEVPQWVAINTRSVVMKVTEFVPTLEELKIDEEQENPLKFYRQCTFQQQNKQQVAWVEETGLRVGSRVTFKDDESGWWRVSAIGEHRIPESQAKQLERQYLRHRDTTDI